MKKYLRALIVVIAATGLAGCVGQSQYSVQFFKVFGSGDVYGEKNSTHVQDVRVITISQTDPIHPGTK